MRKAVAAASAIAVALTPALAHAYRPFDGTDADVAEPGEFELELGPAHFYGQGPRHYVIAPATVLNLGLVNRLELVVDARQFFALDEKSWQVLDTDVFLKYVIREGTLQGKTGISIAIEGGPLVPEVHGEKSFGAQADTIFSYRWPSMTAHFNEQLGYSRLGHAALFSSVIVEGPHGGRVRPVAELLVEDATKEDFVISGLVGAIWRASDSISLDAALRAGRVGDDRMAEVRLGFTWTVPIWESAPRGE